MSSDIKPISILYLWLLVTRGGESLLKDITPEFKAENRRPLVAAGLLREEGRPIRLTVTDAGWHHLATHVDAPLNTRSAAGIAVTQGLLGAMHRVMERDGYSLAELFSPPSPALPASTPTPAEPEPATQTGDTGDADDDTGLVWNRLAEKWDALQDADRGLRLEAVRPVFPDLSRERLDQALLALQRAGKIVVYPYDDGERITPAVREAALTVNGRALHVLYKK